TNERIQFFRIETNIAIMLPGQLEKGEPIFVGGKVTIAWLVQINETASDDEQRHHRLRRIISDDQGVRFASGLVHLGAGFSHPIMFQVSPVTTHRVAVHSADVIMRPDNLARTSYQDIE